MFWKWTNENRVYNPPTPSCSVLIKLRDKERREEEKKRGRESIQARLIRRACHYWWRASDGGRKKESKPHNNIRAWVEHHQRWRPVYPLSVHFQWTGSKLLLKRTAERQRSAEERLSLVISSGTQQGIFFFFSEDYFVFPFQLVGASVDSAEELKPGAHTKRVGVSVWG